MSAEEEKFDVADGDVKTSETKNNDETGEVKVKVYKLRWYIVGLFAVFPFMNAMVIATWGPISSSAHTAFGFTAADVALVSNLGIIGYIPSFPLYAWMIRSRGIRATMMMGTCFLFVGAALRMVVIFDMNLRWMIHLGQLISSFALPMALVVPPALIATWIPDTQRVAITAFLMLMPSLGGAVNGIAGPQAVRQIPKSVQNLTIGNYSFNECLQNNENNTICYVDLPDGIPTPRDIQRDILILVSVQNGIIGLATILVFIYYPANPVLPPSVSSSKKRTGIKDGLRLLKKNRAFWLITLASCLPNASYTVLIVLLEPVLATLGYMQKTVGWLIFISLTIAIVLSIIAGGVMDRFKQHSKKVLIGLETAFAILSLWQALQIMRIIPQNIITIYVNVILCATVAAALFPVTCDVTCEVSYPVTEGLVMGIFQLGQIVMLTVLLGAVMIPGFNVAWTVWLIFAFVTVSIPLFIVCPMPLKRYELDKKQQEAEAEAQMLNGNADEKDTSI